MCGQGGQQQQAAAGIIEVAMQQLAASGMTGDGWHLQQLNCTWSDSMPQTAAAIRAREQQEQQHQHKQQQVRMHAAAATKATAVRHSSSSAAAAAAAAAAPLTKGMGQRWKSAMQ
jgi:hypothetical protein